MQQENEEIEAFSPDAATRLSNNYEGIEALEMGMRTGTHARTIIARRDQLYAAIIFYSEAQLLEQTESGFLTDHKAVNWERDGE